MIAFTNQRSAGYLPRFFNEADPRPAIEQIKANYIGGWWPFKGFDLAGKNDVYALKYPGDRPMRLVSRGLLRDETILLFEHDWVVVLQKDGTWECSRMD